MIIKSDHFYAIRKTVNPECKNFIFAKYFYAIRKTVNPEYFFLILALLMIFSCGSYSASYKERAEKAAENKGDMVIGIVDSSIPPTSFVQGVKLAVEELNKTGGVLGRAVRPLFYDDRRSIARGRDIASELAKNTDVIAVIGHRYSAVAIGVSVTYEENGMVFISPGGTEQDLIREGNTFTFRNIPDQADSAKAAAEFASRNGYKKMLIIYDRETSGKRLAEIFQGNARDLGIEITDERSYSEWESDFKLLVSDIIENDKADAIFLGGILPSAARLIKELRDMGCAVPIIGSELLDSQELFSVAGKSAEGTVLFTVFDPKLTSSFTREFVKNFKLLYGVDPDTWAAQGYDAVRLLAYSVEKSGSRVPINISTTLRLLKKWEGITGSYSFKQDGNITGKSLFFKKVRNGNFEFLERELRTNISPFEVLKDITLRLPLEAVTIIDPGLLQDNTSIEVAEQLFLGLTDFDPKTYMPVPELAKDWTASNDGKTYTFHLRQDAKWTDGEPVTAQDVVWAVRRNLSPEIKSPYSYMLHILKNAQAANKGEIPLSEIGVRAEDDFTVSFDLEYPAAYFPSVAGLWMYRPLPRKTIEAYGERWTEPENIRTNGSYRLAAWEKGLVMILRKNPNYYDAGHVSIPEVRYYTIPDSAMGLSMYKADQLDIMGDWYLRLPPDQLPAILSNSEMSAQYFRKPVFGIYFYVFNTKVPPTDNPLVRKAISAAINRSLLIAVVTKGEEEPAATFVPPEIMGNAAAETLGSGFNPVQARKWLAEAGYPDGKGFPDMTVLYNESETHEKIAKAVQTFLKYYLNIRIRTQAQKWEDYAEATTGKFSEAMIRFAYTADYPDANNFLELFNPRGSNNLCKWDNAEFAELIEKAQKETVPEQRKKYYRRADQILCEEECAIIPIFFNTAHYLVNPRVKGWYNMAIGGQHIRNWYLEE